MILNFSVIGCCCICYDSHLKVCSACILTLLIISEPFFLYFNHFTGSREQNYRPEDCAVCHASLVAKRGSGFWEGGKGENLGLNFDGSSCYSCSTQLLDPCNILMVSLSDNNWLNFLVSIIIF